MDRIIDEAIRDGDPLGYFPAMYRAVTLRIKDRVDTGRFLDGPRMDRFVGRFAARYLDALDAWRGGAPITRSWRVTFELAKRGDEVTIFQHLCLGMNAHINLDLAIVAAEFGAEEAIAGGGIAELAGDFEAINTVLAELLDDVQRVIDDFSPAFRLMDRMLVGADEAVANFSLRRAREGAWREAEHLSALPDALRPAAIERLDRCTKFLARLIEAPGGLAGQALRVARALESRDVPAIVRAIAVLR